MSTPSNDLIFVYGTLRQGASNAFRMNGAVFQSRGKAPGRLYRVEWYPGAIFDANATTSIIGELYQITAEHLQALDDFEGEEYRRVNILVTTEEGEVLAAAWEYRPPINHLTQLMTGDWLQEYQP
jgi:gamma-glutamylcyclotransferase (GGCT)/AIG2-like uncharacterized protein YtfP